MGWIIPPLHWHTKELMAFSPNIAKSHGSLGWTMMDLYFSYSGVMKLCPNCDLRRLRTILLGASPPRNCLLYKALQNTCILPSEKISEIHTDIFESIYLVENAGRKATGKRCWVSICVNTCSPSLQEYPEMLVRWAIILGLRFLLTRTGKGRNFKGFREKWKSISGSSDC